MIRHAQLSDFNYILEIYNIARAYMLEQGNGAQWGNRYPSQSILENDIKKQVLYVLEEDGGIHAVFAFIIGDDPSYHHIDNGTWLNDEPYGTMHRIASDGKIKGVFKKCLDYCKSRINNLRIDTHENNRTMKYLIENNGFQKCGIIYVKDGSPRFAYQFTR